MATTNARWALSGITGVDLIHLLASIGSRNKMANFVSPILPDPEFAAPCALMRTYI
jgi:hypothetical protein